MDLIIPIPIRFLITPIRLNTIPDTIRQPKTPPRQLSDTVQTPYNMALYGQSKAIERKGTSQLNPS